MNNNIANSVALTGSDQAAYTPGTNGFVVFRGFCLRETAGAVATVRIYDNTAASGTLLETISLAANESRSEFYETGKFAKTGVYVKIVAGAIEGSVFVS